MFVLFSLPSYGDFGLSKRLCRLVMNCIIPLVQLCPCCFILKGVKIRFIMYSNLYKMCEMFVSSPMIFFYIFFANVSDILKLCICHFKQETKLRPFKTSKVLSFVYYRMTTFYNLFFPQFLSHKFETLHICYSPLKICIC